MAAIDQTSRMGAILAHAPIVQAVVEVQVLTIRFEAPSRYWRGGRRATTNIKPVDAIGSPMVADLSVCEGHAEPARRAGESKRDRRRALAALKLFGALPVAALDHRHYARLPRSPVAGPARVPDADGQLLRNRTGKACILDQQVRFVFSEMVLTRSATRRRRTKCRHT